MIETPDFVTDAVWSAADGSWVVGETAIFRLLRLLHQMFQYPLSVNYHEKIVLLKTVSINALVVSLSTFNQTPAGQQLVALCMGQCWFL